LIKQLAFHKFMGRPGVAYESAQTRKFQLGRTEVIRSVSNESKAWVEAMRNPTINVCIVLSFFERNSSPNFFQHKGHGLPPLAIHTSRRPAYPIRYLGC
jgi:hypothetical protein